MKSYSMSIQRYVFTIGCMQYQNKQIHQIDIAIKLGYTRASVCKAMQSLQELHLIQIKKTEIILSESGSSLYYQLKHDYHCLLECLNMLDMPDHLAQAYAEQLLFVVDETLLSYLPSPTSLKHVKI